MASPRFASMWDGSTFEEAFMKRAVLVSLGVMSVMLVASNAMAQRGGAPACTTVACDLQGDWGRNRALLLGVANAMPEDKFGAKPTPPQESFGERIMHVVNIDLKLL